MPQIEVIEDALRNEVKLVPEVVIRELVANALIHQEFAMGGASVMVEIYSNRAEIAPGEPAAELVDGVTVECRMAEGEIRGAQARVNSRTGAGCR